MRRLLPDPLDPVSPEEAYLVDRPPPADRPWLLLDMVASLDGATALEGRSGGLGGDGDRAVFRTLRSLADVVLAGAGTVRAEDYGPARLTEGVQEVRVLRGQAPVPPIAVVSRRLDLPLDSRLFAGEPPPLVITTPASPLARRAELAQRADLLLAGHGEDVDLVDALRSLREMGHEVVVCEGGPTLNGALLALDLVDELCLTVSPRMVGGASERIVSGPAVVPPRGFRLAHVLEQDGELYLRAVRDRS